MSRQRVCFEHARECLNGHAAVEAETEQPQTQRWMIQYLLLLVPLSHEFDLIANSQSKFRSSVTGLQLRQLTGDPSSNGPLRG